jgi:hypothetical protein
VTRLLLAATAILGLARVLWAVPTAPVRYGLVSAPSFSHRCFGLWGIPCPPSGIRYVRDEREMLLAMLPDADVQSNRLPPLGTIYLRGPRTGIFGGANGSTKAKECQSCSRSRITHSRGLSGY